VAGSPERKIRILGREVRPSDIGIAGFFIAMGSIWARNEKVVLPAMLFGMSLMAYSAYKTDQENQKSPPS